MKTKHGSFYDRGRADSFYGRDPDPHAGNVIDWGKHLPRIKPSNTEEREEYLKGYNDNEDSGDKKDWR